MKRNVWKFNILMFAIVLGLLCTLQFKNVQGQYEYVPMKVIHDYKIAMESEKKEIANLREMIEDRKNKITEYEKIKEEGGRFKETMEEEINAQKLISGFVDVEGPGVILTLDDGTRELYEGEEADAVMVHDADILNIIRDLKVAGAEAISINGQRLLANSEINCGGHSMRINNQFFAQPFIIKAIGDPKKLEAALILPVSYGAKLKDIYGLYVEVNTVLNMKIPKYSEGVDFKYLKVLEEGE
ncbi:DUF881 domain-containing protein [Marinisporobacter balticus]|uniref:Uncharacterized protein YlxW (UPF0749 family) n=1 Tax=Marinisporobacter balticus TaxID=2018667 RepID=A0A4R2L976_9FIRM|nr:DUF881 domain-containing protein [Marinisporobacter balticus]TCO79298.1 uncharacterized protein YlxW (UPF0749 family) [Marinisporobacter balticus]